MTAHPHDITDLYFAPVVLAVNARIDELSQLTPEDLIFQVALQADSADWTPELRESGLLRAVGYLVDLHDWELALDPRGIQLRHKQHSVVLGVPQTFIDYLAMEPAAHSPSTAG